MSLDDELGLRRQFRYYSRCVAYAPNNDYFHQRRIQIASNFVGQSEPLQGALADYFFAKWYNLDNKDKQLLESLITNLPAYIVQDFLGYIRTGEHLPNISALATRYSVLVLPSMNVPTHKLYVGKDEARQIAETLKNTLLAAKAENDVTKMAIAEQEYLAHCVACQDRMGFMMTWFALSKMGWQFDDKWAQCRQKLMGDELIS